MKNLKKTLLKVKPDAIINTAAMTQVDDCEIHKEACDILNIDVAVIKDGYFGDTSRM